MQYDACGSSLESLDYAAWSKDLRVQWWYIWWYLTYVWEANGRNTATSKAEIYTTKRAHNYPKPNIFVSQQTCPPKTQCFQWVLSQNELTPPPHLHQKGLYYYIIDRFRTLHDMSLYVHHYPSESASRNTAPVGPKSSVSWIREDSHTKKIYTENFKKTLNRHFQKQKIKEKGLFSVWINAIHPLNLRFGGCWCRFLLLQSIWRCFQHGAALRFIKSTSNPP